MIGAQQGSAIKRVSLIHTMWDYDLPIVGRFLQVLLNNRNRSCSYNRSPFAVGPNTHNSFQRAHQYRGHTTASK